MDKHVLARSIAGPHGPVPETSKFPLELLRDVRWGRLTPQERAQFLWKADCLLREFNIVPKPVPTPVDTIRLSSFQRDVLQHLFEDEKREFYSSLNNIAVNLQREKNRVRLACRALKRKGFAKQVPFHDDEGFIRGSGYGITPAGIAYGEKQGWKGGA